MADSAQVRLVLISGLWRALRTFLQAFLSIISAAPVLDVSIPVLKTAAMAGFAAVLALGMRLLDETPVPTVPKG